MTNILRPKSRRYVLFQQFSGMGNYARSLNRRKFSIFILLATAVAILPYVLLAVLSRYLEKPMETDVSALGAVLDSLTVSKLFFMTILVPLIETVVLISLIRMLRHVVDSPIRISSAAAVLCGAAHGLYSPLCFFGIIWSFFVFSLGYIFWHTYSWKCAALASYLPHVLLNIIVLAWIAVCPRMELPYGQV